jgi:hypothetical protein
LQRALLERQGNKDAMMALLYDYRRNLDLYPKWQAYFREHRPPMLIVWGKNDIIFPPSGAHPYLRDLPKAELHLLDTGHFALEDKHEHISALNRRIPHAQVREVVVGIRSPEVRRQIDSRNCRITEAFVDEMFPTSSRRRDLMLVVSS